MRFKALQTFESDETKSEYVEGLTYTARTEQLAQLVEAWVAEGKVEIINQPQAIIRGA